MYIMYNNTKPFVHNIYYSIKNNTRTQHYNPGFCLPSLKSAWDLVYPRQNIKILDVKEILRNLIGCLEDWETRKD